MRYLLEQMPGVFFELYFVFFFFLSLSPEEKIKRYKSLRQSRGGRCLYRVLSARLACRRPRLPPGDLHSVVAVSTSAKAKVRARECVPSPPATVGPGDNLPLKYQCGHSSIGHI